jgi:hypothetical protein
MYNDQPAVDPKTVHLRVLRDLVGSDHLRLGAPGQLDDLVFVAQHDRRVCPWVSSLGSQLVDVEIGCVPTNHLGSINVAQIQNDQASSLIQQVYFLELYIKVHNLQLSQPEEGLVEDLDDLRPVRVCDRDDFNIGVIAVSRVDRLAEVNSNEEISKVERVKLPVGKG